MESAPQFLYAFRIRSETYRVGRRQAKQEQAKYTAHSDPVL